MWIWGSPVQARYATPLYQELGGIGGQALLIRAHQFCAARQPPANQRRGRSTFGAGLPRSVAVRIDALPARPAGAFAGCRASLNAGTASAVPRPHPLWNADGKAAFRKGCGRRSCSRWPVRGTGRWLMQIIVEDPDCPQQNGQVHWLLVGPLACNRFARQCEQ